MPDPTSSAILAPELAEGRSATCQACGSRGLEAFYAARSVPIHSCVLLPSKEEALRFPRGDLLLGFCAACGFIQNLRFDPSLLDYSHDYEESQGFSARFNEFARWLAEDLIQRHGLRGKTVLDIGCGKGAFLELICELGPNRGVGIDPASAPERISADDAGRVRLIRDFYDEASSHLTGELVACRHTLEHVAPVRTFVELMRRSVEGTEGAALFIEVPDVERVLREAAFWDVYYEHCSYFTLGSLERLLRSTGYEPVRSQRAFDDQYLLVDAKLSAQADPSAVPHDDLPGLAADVRRFAEKSAAHVEEWRRVLSGVRATGGRAVVWGAGSKAVAFLTSLGVGDVIEYAVDINPFKHGTYLPGAGQRVVEPGFLAEYRPDLVLAMNRIYLGEIGDELRRMAVSAELLAV